MLQAKNRQILAIVLLFILVITGCGANGQGQTASQPNQVTTEGQPQGDSKEAGADNQNARIIQHAGGSTEVKGTPTKVVTLFQGATETSLLLGVKPVGAVESVVEKPWYKFIRGQMEGAANVGAETQPTLEEIIALQPDVIIATKSRHEKIYEQLTAIAPTVMTEDHFHWKDTLSLTAKALNKEKEEKEFLTEWDKKVATFKEKMGNNLQSKVSIIDFRSDHVRIFYQTFPNQVLTDLGFTFPTDGEDNLKLTTKENIPQMDADVIFDMTSLDRDDGRVDTRKEWTSHPLWKNLRAVKSNKIYLVDPVIWTNSSGPMAAMKMVDDVYKYFDLK